MKALDQVIDILRQVHETALDVGDTTPAHIGVTLSTDGIFNLLQLLEQDQAAQLAYQRRMRRATWLGAAALIFSLVSLAGSLIGFIW